MSMPPIRASARTSTAPSGLSTGLWPMDLPSENRQLLLEQDWNYWKEAILHDLERVHRDIRQCVSRIDIMRLGHAMARPKVGAIFSAERRNLAKARKDDYSMPTPTSAASPSSRKHNIAA
jgi:hypothetical protein